LSVNRLFCQIQWPEDSNETEVDPFKHPTTCHELFGNRQDGEQCQFCRDQLKNDKSLKTFCGDCGGFSASRPAPTSLAQSKLFDHHLCVSDCPFDPASSNVMRYVFLSILVFVSLFFKSPSFAPQQSTA
jgi:hypothetical protein